MFKIIKQFFITFTLLLFFLIFIVIDIIFDKSGFNIFYNPYIIFFIIFLTLGFFLFDLGIEEYEDIVALFKNKEEPQQVKSVLSYNTDEGILLFKNKKILISKSKNTDPHYLLITLFKNINKTWNYDEIYEDWVWTNEIYNKDMWNKFYQASLAVNRKIAQETTVKDFLIPTNKTVEINKKYL